jgi:protein gp37
MTTKIEWVQNVDGTRGNTWNPITGCTKISRGCQNCYAERIAKRLAGRHGYPREEPFRLTLHPDRLSLPLTWNKPSMIFLCSMSDFFHTEVPEGYILKIIEVIKRCPQHVFQILTKRPERMVEIDKIIKKWPNNVWLGVTVEAKEYVERIALLKEAHSKVRFLSCEPLLDDLGSINLNGIHWVIVGGESGPRARLMKKEWVLSLRNHCLQERIPFFFKQWGGVNKKRTGRRLEGMEWSQMPLIPSHQKSESKLPL